MSFSGLFSRGEAWLLDINGCIQSSGPLESRVDDLRSSKIPRAPLHHCRKLDAPWLMGVASQRNEIRVRVRPHFIAELITF